MDFEDLMLSEICQMEKDKYSIMSYVESEKAKHKNWVDWWLPGTRGEKNGTREEKPLLSNDYRVPVWEDEKVLEMTGGGSCTTK